VAGLVILGPERLPGAIRWTANALRQARDYLSGATSQLRDDFGPEFDDLREPISELQKLRGMTPRAALTKHLLDGDDSLFTWTRGLRDGQTTERFDGRADVASTTPPTGPDIPDQLAAPTQPAQQPAVATPFDSDAT
jgi:sec-independent protein translocase protein TatB